MLFKKKEFVFSITVLHFAFFQIFTATMNTKRVVFMLPRRLAITGWQYVIRIHLGRVNRDVICQRVAGPCQMYMAEARVPEVIDNLKYELRVRTGGGDPFDVEVGGVYTIPLPTDCFILQRWQQRPEVTEMGELLSEQLLGQQLFLGR